MSPHSISVIIPALNEAAQIGECVRHVRAQGAGEVIVVDGGSGDETRARAAEAGAAALTSPAGRARQQNLGAAAAAGTALLFLHADCRLPADGLRQVCEALSDRCQAGSFRHRIDSRRWLYRCIEWGDGVRQRVFKMPYGDQGIFVTRALFEDVGRFPDVQLMEDVLLIRRLRRRTRMACVAGPLLTSPRRWEERGPVRQFLLNQYLIVAERIGVPPDALARHYRRKPRP